jgi:hypothetical protein
MIITGGFDGKLNFYKLNLEKKLIMKRYSLDVTGVINSIEIDPENRLIAVVAGGENRLGRWITLDQRSSIKIFKF